MFLLREVLQHCKKYLTLKDWRTAPAAPMPTFVDTGTVVVDKSNLKLYREALAAHPKPLWRLHFQWDEGSKENGGHPLLPRFDLSASVLHLPHRFEGH